AANQNILAGKNVILKAVSEGPVEGARSNQVLHFEMACIELANRERDAVQAAGWNDNGDAGASGEPGIEDRVGFRDVAAEPAGNVFDRDHERSFAKRNFRYRLEVPALLDKHRVGAIDHDFADRVVEDEVLDGFQKRKDGFKSIH